MKDKKAQKTPNYILMDIIYIICGFALAGIIICVLFNLKWQQNARREAQNNSDGQVKTWDEAIPDDLNMDDDVNEGMSEDNNDEFIAENDTEDDIEDEPVLYDEDDVIWFIGGDFAPLLQRYNNSEQILGVKSHYFVDEYLAVVYDDDTKQILSLESDGPGKMPIRLSGMKIGMSRDEVNEKLSLTGIDSTPIDGELDGISFSAGVGDMRYKAEVYFEDDIVMDIICTTKYR